VSGATSGDVDPDTVRTPDPDPGSPVRTPSGHRPDTVRTGDPGSGIEHPGATSREGPRSAPNSEFPEFKLARFGRFQGGNPLSRVGGIGQVWRSWLARDRPSWRRPGRAPDRAPGPSKPGSGIGGSGLWPNPAKPGQTQEFVKLVLSTWSHDRRGLNPSRIHTFFLNSRFGPNRELRN